MTGRFIRIAVPIAALVLVNVAGPAPGAEKLILLTERIDAHKFEVAADGSKVYLAAGNCAVLDGASGKVVERFQVGGNGLAVLPDGWFLLSTGGPPWVGRVALVRPDGTEAKRIVGKGDCGDDLTKPDAQMKILRGDMTGWTSPCAVAADPQAKLFFAVDTTMAQRDDRNLPDPDWSRIAVFDFDGKYVRDINRYNALATNAQQTDDRRTWYTDIEVDPARKRVYVGARRFRELWCFDYEGKPLGKIKPEHGVGAIAVFPDGRVAISHGWTGTVYGTDFEEVTKFDTPQVEGKGRYEGIRDLETDAAGRLYAITGDPTFAFIRWNADLKSAEALGGPDFLHVSAELPGEPVTAGQTLAIKVSVRGRPEPRNTDRWQALVRPADGSNLAWRPLPAEFRQGVLHVVLPEDLQGICQLAVMLGEGSIPLSDRKRSPVVQGNVAVVPAGAERSVAVIPAAGRRVFQQGEPVAIQVVRRDAAAAEAERAGSPLTLELSLQAGEDVLRVTETTIDRHLALEIPAAVTRRLAPGPYVIRPRIDGHQGYALGIEIVPSEPDSPMDRIVHHGMANAGGRDQHRMAGLPEKLAFARAWAEGMRRLHVTRETDRIKDVSTWRRDAAPVNLAAPGLAPPEYYSLPGGRGWTVESYLEQALRNGIRVDSMLLGHCSGVRHRDWWLDQLNPVLQRVVQGRLRYPSFHGFVYNDEMFFGQWVFDWTASDVEWLKKKEAEFKAAGAKNPWIETCMAALRRMYDSFDAAVLQVAPELNRTCTPMWQYPAVEGSYQPVVYKNATETYSHFVSEGYHTPWYAPHSAENLRRPRPDGTCLPVMGVVDSGVGFEWGYDKNAMQVLSRGVQGVGYQEGGPWRGALCDSIRTAHRLARVYGPVFAECPPANEAAILYSYSQDVTERRNGPGTPHWERVYELFGAGLMAGAPMSILCEEDVAAGYLLQDGKPRTGMLFLVGQKEPLPEDVQQGIARFVAAGGKLFTDADGADYTGATRLPLATHDTGPLHGQTYAADSAWPMMMPVYEKLAAELHKAIGGLRRFPVDTDDPWIAKGQFDGGSVRYVMLATEVSPYPWNAGATWSLMSAGYNGQWLPKNVKLSFPMTGSVVYDVFEQKVIHRQPKGETARLDVDMTTYPGRLLAVAPEELAGPRLEGTIRDGTLHYRATATGTSGNRVAARVPLRIRLLGDRDVVCELFRGTDGDGNFAASLPLPVNQQQYVLEITELLGGKASRLDATSTEADGDTFVVRDRVDIQRPARMAALIEEAKKTGLTLAPAKEDLLTASQVDRLAEALKQHGVELKTATTVPEQPVPGLYLAVGYYGSEDALGPMLHPAREQNLFDYPLTRATVPGPGRGILCPVFAPRAWRENLIGLVGGDAEGLNRTVATFVEWLAADKPASADSQQTPTTEQPKYDLVGKPADSAPVAKLSDLTGARLTAVHVAPDARHLLVTAEGFLKNVALVVDEGREGRLVTARRVGQSRAAPKSLFVSGDARLLGASGRVTADFGQGFCLMNTDGDGQTVFAGFGDMPPQTHAFAATTAGDCVVVGGVYGVVCWKKDASAPGGWKEAWAIDHFQEFDRLDWPVSGEAERIPRFDAYIPIGADYALIVFNEFSQNGWVKPEHFCRAHVRAVALADGKPRWRFDVPIPDTQLWPELVMTPDAKRLLLRVQMGGWNKETFRYFTLDPASGKPIGSWDSATAPSCIALAATTGHAALAYSSGADQGESAARLLEVRAADGKLLHNTVWDSQPVSLAYDPAGKRLFIADDAGTLSCVEQSGQRLWRTSVGCTLQLTAGRDAGGTMRLYAAGRDGRLRCYDHQGNRLWSVNLTPAMRSDRPMDLVARAGQFEDGSVLRPRRASNVSQQVPDGPNLLADAKPTDREVRNAEGKVTGRQHVATNGKATLSLGGTSSWMSDGRLEIAAELLANGKTDDVDTPWLHLDEVFWDGCAGRQVYVVIEFAEPTDVRSITVYENPKHPESWPTQGLVQIWDEKLKAWKTARMGLFLEGPVNTYELNLSRVTKVRYLPWNNYFRNFYTSEIEVR